MFRTTIKSLIGNKARVVATAFSVVLGIAFLAGTLVFTDTTQAAFDELFADVFENTDAQVRSSETIEAGFGLEVRSRIDQSVLDLVVGLDGVAAADGFVQGFAQVVGKDGEPLGNPAQGPPTFGFSWSEDEQLNSYRLADGREPTNSTDVVLDQTTAEAGDLVIGDEVTIIASTGTRTFNLVGVAKFGDSGSAGGATSALFELSTAQELLGAEGMFDAIAVRAVDGVSEEDIASRIAAVLPDGVESITGSVATEEAQSSIAQSLSFFNILLLSFAAIAVFVSIFVITNTFAILIAQRSRELALLRAIGATRSQVLRSVMVESLAIGIVGSILGIIGGVVLSFGIRAGLEAIGIALPGGGLVVGTSTIVVGMLVGVIVTMLAAIFPAWRASRIAPIEALRQADADHGNATGPGS